MRIFDDLIEIVDREVASLPHTVHGTADVVPWKDEGENILVLTKESAFELGAGGTGHCAALITRDATLFGNSAATVTVIGDDLCDIKKDCAFARIAVVLTDDIDEDRESAYRDVQSVDFVKYHVFPAGYMLRISSEGGKEQVRVGKRALKDGISFASVGKTYIERYMRNPHVKAVKLIFVTGDAALSENFGQVAKKSAERTAALNKILKEVMLDCDACALKPVCDEVEELRELHFGINKKSDK